MARTEIRGTQIVDESVSLTADVAGTLPVANGGTGATTHTTGAVLVGNGTGAVQNVAPGTSGNVLQSNGSAWTSAALDLSDVGVTASASEVNILDGATVSTTELNYVGGVTSSIQTQLGGKVDKVTTPNTVYAVNSGGSQVSAPLASAATASTLAFRDSNGRLKAADPSADADVATKGWVDDAVDAMVSGSANGTPTALTLWKGTQTQYDGLGSYDSNTVYVVTE